uniref:Uncharacterized protein n=1 Tax=Daphnia galeata TaxID=27404 RepID=A0A8J2RE65_9CRUS|nr:unnamed protein product [Daphnia galeata]
MNRVNGQFDEKSMTETGSHCSRMELESKELAFKIKIQHPEEMSGNERMQLSGRSQNFLCMMLTPRLDNRKSIEVFHLPMLFEPAVSTRPVAHSLGIRRRCEMPCWSRAQFSDRCILPFHREQLELQGEKKNRMVTSKFGIGCASMSMERRRVRRRHDSSNREHAREEEKGGCRVWGWRGSIPTLPSAKSKDMMEETKKN